MSKHIIDCDELDDSEPENTPYFQVLSGTQGKASGVRMGSDTENQAREELKLSSGFSTTTVYQEVLGRKEGSYCWYRVERTEDEDDTEGGNIFSKPSKVDDKERAAFIAKTSTWMQKFVDSAKQQSATEPKSSWPPEEVTGATEGAVDGRGITSPELPTNVREEKLPESQMERPKRAKPGPKHSSRLGVGKATTGKRSVVRETLDKFRELLEQMEAEVDSAGKTKRRRVDMQVASRMREMKWSLDEDVIGEVEGVEIGDGFDWRAEMYVIGLHKELIAGIHVLKRPDGPIATSVVFSYSSSYSDNIYRENEPSIYSGEGGMPSTRGSTTGELGYQDQTLTGGNLALKRSADQNIPIRVIKGVQRVNADDKKYEYDGLYEITECRYETGVHGNKVYKFVLSRLPRH